ncbi:ASCH domain-containing protein [Lacticaseibacillus daqingensis]|uniref:ASCH domain-containing protein n=1 Tax=Lacticaseibacillus daqingensis TaxID=2486014 RepID=UPI000F77906A|nr:ASCH domain-containing protein [Lacticaseibacillus daqingensis]
MEMRLTHDQFQRIVAGTKTIEIRLNDAKRQQLRIGDALTFTDLLTGDTHTVQLSAIAHFATFAALYRRYGGLQVGSAPTDSVAQMVTETYQLYTPAQEAEFGVLALHPKEVPDEK